jgi:4-amino-4-deoxy-L-arabinose transferase-like glycosyltransferase
VWDGWIGRRTFWQDPLYPYLLAAVYATLGTRPAVVYAVHALAGVACVWLVYSITSALFGRASAVIAGIAAALYGPLIFYETLRLREVAITLAALAAVRAAMSALALRRASPWFAAGLAAGVAVLLKSSALLFAGALAAIIAWRERDDMAEVARAAGAFAAGIAIAMAAARGTQRGGRRRAVQRGVDRAAQFPQRERGGLLARPGHAREPPRARHSRRHRRRRTRGSCARRSRRTRRGRNWLALLGRKLAVFWRAAEIPDNANWRYFVLQAPWLRASLGFGLRRAARRRSASSWARGEILCQWVALLNVAAGVAVCVSSSTSPASACRPR